MIVNDADGIDPAALSILGDVREVTCIRLIPISG